MNEKIFQFEFLGIKLYKAKLRQMEYNCPHPERTDIQKNKKKYF